MSRRIRSSMGGCMLKRPVSRSPRRRFMMDMWAVAGLAFMGMRQSQGSQRIPQKKAKAESGLATSREVKGRIRLSLQEYLGFSKCVQEVRRNDRPPYLIGIGSPAGCLTVAIAPLEGSETPGVTESLLQDQFTVGGASSVWLMPASCHFRDPTSRLKVQNSWNLTGLSLSPATTWPVDSSRV